MIKVNSTVTMNFPRIEELSKAAITALKDTAEALHTEVMQAQVMPRDEGTLQNESTYIDISESENGCVSFVSDQPYARRLYYHPEYNFQFTENPNAKGNWFEDWQEGGKHKDFVKKAFKMFLKQEGGL